MPVSCRFPHEVLSHGCAALADESHPLHTYLQYMFERLASQSLTPRDLRYEKLNSFLSTTSQMFTNIFGACIKMFHIKCIEKSTY